MKDYVYLYLDPRKFGFYEYCSYFFNFEPIYVGKGSKDRCFEHLSRTDHAPLPCKIEKLNRLGYQPIIIKYKFFNSSDDAFDFEIELIASIGRKDLGKGPLVNLSDGGEGNIGFVYSDEFKKQHSERMLQWAKDNPVSDETKRKISEAGKGRKQSKEHVKRRIESKGGYAHPDETKKKISAARQCSGPLSNETKEKISKALKGRIISEQQKQLISKANSGRVLPKHRCTYCGKYADGGNYNRWHGKKCREYKKDF